MAPKKRRACPFCGATDWYVHTELTYSHFVRCNACWAEGPPEKTRPDAVEAWNTRHRPRKARE
jgi:Lar family restriction alleviation protein